MATGCDNVDWGGVELELTPPPVSAAPVAPGDSSTAVPAGPRAYGPLLLAGVRDGERVTLSLVGEVRNGSLAAFPADTSELDVAHLDESFVSGSSWTLFSGGMRVGTMVADEVGSDASFCSAHRTVSGVVELVPAAATAEKFLALPSAAGSERPYGQWTAYTDDYDQRVASLNLANDAIPRFEAAWPTEGVLAARQDIQAFRLSGASSESIAATFVYRDQLAVAPPGQGAYALFLMGGVQGGEYREAFSWYRAVDTEGKGAPRYFDHLDWDGDGEDEILLEVLGASRRWHATLDRRGGEWVRSFQDSCGSGSG